MNNSVSKLSNMINVINISGDTEKATPAVSYLPVITTRDDLHEIESNPLYYEDGREVKQFKAIVGVFLNADYQDPMVIARPCVIVTKPYGTTNRYRVFLVDGDKISQEIESFNYTTLKDSIIIDDQVVIGSQCMYCLMSKSVNDDGVYDTKEFVMVWKPNLTHPSKLQYIFEFSYEDEDEFNFDESPKIMAVIAKAPNKLLMVYNSMYDKTQPKILDGWAAVSVPYRENPVLYLYRDEDNRYHMEYVDIFITKTGKVLLTNDNFSRIITTRELVENIMVSYNAIIIVKDVILGPKTTVQEFSKDVLRNKDAICAITDAFVEAVKVKDLTPLMRKYSATKMVPEAVTKQIFNARILSNYYYALLGENSMMYRLYNTMALIDDFLAKTQGSKLVKPDDAQIMVDLSIHGIHFVAGQITEINYSPKISDLIAFGNILSPLYKISSYMQNMNEVTSKITDMFDEYGYQVGFIVASFAKLFAIK